MIKSGQPRHKSAKTAAVGSKDGEEEGSGAGPGGQFDQFLLEVSESGREAGGRARKADFGSIGGQQLAHSPFPAN